MSKILLLFKPITVNVTVAQTKTLTGIKTRNQKINKFRGHIISHNRFQDSISNNSSIFKNLSELFPQKGIQYGEQVERHYTVKSHTFHYRLRVVFRKLAKIFQFLSSILSQVTVDLR